MGAAAEHRYVQMHEALRSCELSMTEREQADLRKSMYGLGWDGQTMVPLGMMAYLIGRVSPMKLDQALRDRLLIGHFEDVQ